jgi:hypothetical protein
MQVLQDSRLVMGYSRHVAHLAWAEQEDPNDVQTSRKRLSHLLRVQCRLESARRSVTACMVSGSSGSRKVATWW